MNVPQKTLTRAPFAGISWSGFYGKSWKMIAKDLWNEISDDDIFNGAAAVAYYFLFSIFPAMIFLLSLLPFLPIPGLQAEIMNTLEQAMPGDTFVMFRDTVLGVVAKKHEGLLSLGALLTLWGASAGIYGLMQQINYTYDVEESRPYWKVRGTAVLLLLAFGVLTVVALSLVIAGDSLEKWLSSQVSWGATISFAYNFVRWFLVAAAFTLALSLVYYYGPDVKQQFRFVTPGCLLGVVLVVAASIGFKAYVAKFADYNATYGSLGAIVVLMLWLNLLATVTLLGSEVNALLEHYSPEGKEKGEKAAGEKAA